MKRRSLLKGLLIMAVAPGLARAAVREAETLNPIANIGMVHVVIRHDRAVYVMKVHQDIWLPCNGAALSKIHYPQLYAVMGDVYALPGDSDQDRFRLPDLRGWLPLDAMALLA